MTLDRGLTVAGTVSDVGDRPLVGATVSNRNDATTTDRLRRFELTGCDPGRVELWASGVPEHLHFGVTVEAGSRDVRLTMLRTGPR